MGIVKGQVIGYVSGSVGNMVYKKRGNTCFVSPKPKKYTTPLDSKSVSIRNQFRYVSRVAHTINKIDLLKKLWKEKFPDCYSAYHEILTANIHNFNYYDMSGNPVLTPNPGFCLPDAAVDVINEKLIVNTGCLPPDLNIDYSIEKFIISATLFAVKSRENPEYPPVFFQNKGAKTVLENSSPLQLINNLNSGLIIITDEFYVYKSWSVLITLDKNENPVHYSELLSWP